MVTCGSRLQDNPGFSDGLEAESRILIETAAEQLVELLGDRGRQGLPVRLAGEDAGDGVGNRFRREGLFARQYLVQNATEGPDIGAAVDPAGAGLLGRHVRRRAQNHSRARRGEAQRRRMCSSGAVGVIGEGLGQPEIQDLDLAFRGDLDVGGLEVAVDDALLVGGFERLGDLPGQVQGLVEPDRTAERLAGRQLQHQERHPFGLLEPVDRGDIGMVQRRQQAGFPLEAGQPLRIPRERFGQDLDRHLAAEARVHRAVHFPHAAGAQ